MNRRINFAEGDELQERRFGPARSALHETSPAFQWPVEVKITIYLPHPKAGEPLTTTPYRKHIRIYDVSQLRQSPGRSTPEEAEGRVAMHVHSYRIHPS